MKQMILKETEGVSGFRTVLQTPLLQLHRFHYFNHQWRCKKFKQDNTKDIPGISTINLLKQNSKGKLIHFHN
jgi:hypothetical protein